VKIFEIFQHKKSRNYTTLLRTHQAFVYSNLISPAVVILWWFVQPLIGGNIKQQMTTKQESTACNTKPLCFSSA